MKNPIPFKGKPKPAKTTAKDKPRPKRNPSRIGAYYGGTDDWKGVRTRPAKRLVNGEIRRQTEDIRDQRRDATTLYKDTESGLNNIYGGLNNYIQERNASSLGAWNTAESQNDVAQEALQRQIAGSGAQAAANVSNELARLGITDSGALSSVVGGSQNALNIAAQTTANTDASLNAQRAAGVTIGNLMLGSAQASRASALNQNANDYRDARAEIDDALRDARGARSDLLLQMLEQMRATGWGQHMDQENLDLQKAQFAFQRRQAALARADAKAAGGGGGSGGGGGGGSSYSSGGGSSTGLPVGPATPKSDNPWGPGPMPVGWGKGLGVLSNKKPPKHYGDGKGLGVLANTGANPNNPLIPPRSNPLRDLIYGRR